jgi:NAD(P)H-hydrate epimerase
MRPVLSASQMQAFDRLAIDQLGIPSLVLMETAGRAVAERVFALAAGAPVLVLSGLGNNGGDAAVVARILFDRGLPVELLLAGDPAKASRDLSAQLSIARKLGLEPLVVSPSTIASQLAPRLEHARWVVDGLFGTGLSRPIEGLPLEIIERVNASGVPVVAIDLPSGVDADTGQVLGAAIRAHHTVTFGQLKLGHLLYPGREHAGAVEVADIGLPGRWLDRVGPTVQVLDDADASLVLPPRRADTHKGTYGHLLVVAGVPDRPGSALLAARAALRIGAGLVTVGSDQETVRRLAPAFEELMGLDLGAPQILAERILDGLSERRALAIGPSLVPGPALEATLRDVLEKSAVPAVIDAGALDALGPDPSWLARRNGPSVLTPHPGEMARLSGTDTRTIQRDRLASARALAARTGATVVLKGASTVIAEPSGAAYLIERGNPGMATGGMGDVLTGVIGGLLAQGCPAPIAARAGAQLHAMAGDRAAARLPAGRLLASDLIPELAGLGGRAGPGASS